MPAAAVIPALIVYTKIAAVKKLVVGFWRERRINHFLCFHTEGSGSAVFVWAFFPKETYDYSGLGFIFFKNFGRRWFLPTKD